MLHVKTPEEALRIIMDAFPLWLSAERAPLSACLGRTLSEDVRSEAYVPGFARSTVDGYAVVAADTFGCTDAMPALLQSLGDIPMGAAAPMAVCTGQCAAIPTGGALPDGADAVQMLEYCENYGGGTIGVLKPVAPGNNLIFRGDDASPGRVVLPRGRRMRAQDAGVLAACGVSSVPVCRPPSVGILSTGDELVPVAQTPGAGQVRDVNTAMLTAMMQSYGADARPYGVVPDREPALMAAVRTAVAECDMVLLSGGSSVGAKDAAARVLAAMGEVLFHGVAMKPGKPTLVGRVDGKPVFGLPGHPVAACFVAKLFVHPLLRRWLGQASTAYPLSATLSENVAANGGRALYCAVRLEQTEAGLLAHPVRGKSGLITTLADADGYICIPRDCEGAAAGETVAVMLFEEN